MIRIVTSFGPEHWELCGEKFMRGLKHWPADEIYIYYEGEQPDPAQWDDPRIVWKDLLEVTGCKEYLSQVRYPPIMQGIINGKRIYQFDLFRFCRKMFAQVDAAVDYDGLLYWLDFDTETYNDIPEARLEKYLEGTFMAYMGRPGWHSCASLVGWDCAHVLNQTWWQGYYDIYLSGRVLTLPEWHDSYVLDALREANQIPARNIAEGIEMEAGKPTNVFNLVMDGYAKHNKGNKKLREPAQNGPDIVAGAGHTFHKVCAE